MKYLAFLVTLLAGLAHAQTNRFPPINLYTGDPTGVTCSISNSIVQSSTTGGFYSCVNGVYVSQGGANYPGVTSNGASGLNVVGSVAAAQAVLSQAPISYTYVALFGNSLTASFQEQSGNTYPQALAAILTGKTVTGNYGYPGQTSSQIRVRMNANPAQQLVTVSGGTIPASGGVTVTFSAGYEPAFNGHLTIANCFQMIVQGITGCVSESGGVYTFTRSTAGSSTSSPANSAWVPDFTNVLHAGSTLEIIEAGENNRSNPTLIYADVGAMVAAVKARGDSYLVIGIINADTDTCSVCSQGAANATTNATLAATYGANFFDLQAALEANANPAVPADADLVAVHSTPLSMKAWDGTITLTGPMTDTTTCPTPSIWTYSPFPNSGASLPSTTYGATFYFNDTGEMIYFNSLSGSYTPTACIRGYNGTTPTTHLTGATAKTTDGLHLANNASTQAPPLNGVPGYTFMAQGVANAIGSAVSPSPQLVLPNNAPAAIASSDGTKTLGFSGSGLISNTSVLPSAGCTNCYYGTVNNPLSGHYTKETNIRDITDITWNNGIWQSGGVYLGYVPYPFSLTNVGTSGYTTAVALPTTTSGSGTGMLLTIFASAGKLTGVVVAANGTGYVAGDKVYPTQGGSSADAYITISGSTGGTPFGSFAFAGYLYPACQGCGQIGTSGVPISGLHVQDAANGNIQLAAQGARITSGAGSYWTVSGGLLGENGTYPLLGGSSAFRWGSIRVLGQAGGYIDFTGFNSSSVLHDDSSSGGWQMGSQLEATDAAVVLPLQTSGQTSHKVIGTCGTATRYSPCSLASSDMPATGTWFENGYSGSGAGLAFVQNQTVFYKFPLRNTATFSAITYRVTTADNTSNLYDIGIFSNDGATMYTHLGATAGTVFSPSAVVKALNFSGGSVTLTPGTYIIAVTTNCSASCAVLAGNNVTILSPQTSNAAAATTGGVLAAPLTVGSDNWTTGSTTYWWFALH